MRPWIASFCALLIFFTQVGYYGMFAIEQQLIRFEQKKKLLATLTDEDLEKIPYQASMRMMDDNKEFSLDGEQYDIVKVRMEHGVRIYYAIKDKDETRLLKKMANAGRSHSQGHGAKKGTLKINALYCQLAEVNSSYVNIHAAPQRPLNQQMHGCLYAHETAHPPDQA